MLFSTLPKTDAERAALARSRQLTEFKWSPVRDLPTYYKKEVTMLPEGVEISGFPYASAEQQDTFITENISFETFLSTIPNPYSKIYQPGRSALDCCNYGIVCNGLVRYALGIRERYSTAKWLKIPGMREIAKRGEYTVDDLRLLDVLYAFGEGRNHVSLITDILRDEDGVIRKIEVSESVRPSCKREAYDVDVFYQKYRLFGITRYDLIESIPPFDIEDNEILSSGIDKTRPRLAVDMGNKSNYREGDRVIFSAFGIDRDTVEIYRDNELIESIPIFGSGIFERPLKQGFYTARLRESGETVEFAVNRAVIRYEIKDGVLIVDAPPIDYRDRIIHADFREQKRYAPSTAAKLSTIIYLTDEEKASGHFERKIPDDALYFKVYYENDYGIWSHTMIEL